MKDAPVPGCRDAQLGRVRVAGGEFIPVRDIGEDYSFGFFAPLEPEAGEVSEFFSSASSAAFW